MGCYVSLGGEMLINTVREFNCGHGGDIYLGNRITIYHQIESFMN